MEHPLPGGDLPPLAAEAAILETQRTARCHAAAHDTLARDSDGQVNPRYLFVPRAAGRLACGELAIEPVLGPARVSAVLPRSPDESSICPVIQVAWVDDLGPCHAAGRYPAGQLMLVRVPHHADQLLVRRGLDQAERANRPVSAVIARLIAAHVHPGPRSAIYRFAVSGAAPDEFYDELEVLSSSRPACRQWISGLARFCLDREDAGPVPGWGLPPPLPASLPEERSEARAKPATAQERRTRGTARGGALTGKRMKVETAQQLIDAAFALGVLATRSEPIAARARALIQREILGSLRRRLR